MSNGSIESIVDIGDSLYRKVRRLFPICRSITGNGARETLNILGEGIPMTIHEIPTGTRVFDWTVPKEWNIRGANVTHESGKRFIDFSKNNLHVVGYSTPVDEWVSREELLEHIYSLESHPSAIPYITSYYKERWGFCISHWDREELADGMYHVYIDSDLKDGGLTFGECIIPGQSDQEVFLSTYICHPSMANDNLSGMVIAAAITQKILFSQPRRYTYRIAFVPETIGSLSYLSCGRLDHMTKKVVAGFNLSCLGDNGPHSFVSTRYGNTLADKVASNVLDSIDPNFKRYSFRDCGSDERQYCAPGVDLPVVSLCRSKYGTYPEYHTSLDNLDFVSPTGLRGGYEMVLACIDALENNHVYKTTCLGEPQMGNRGLYPSLSTRETKEKVKTTMSVIAYADGTNDLIDISNIVGVPMRDIVPVAEMLAKEGILEVERK